MSGQFTGIPEIEISSLNCNSLNISSISSLHQQLKLYSIAKLKTDVILLSDVRLNSNNDKNAIDKIKQQLIHNPYSSYDIYHNSPSNSRGVAILL
jgi:hypothetical protein